jgi:hypothetical protein
LGVDGGGVIPQRDPKLTVLPDDVTIKQPPGSLAVATDGTVKNIIPDIAAIPILLKTFIFGISPEIARKPSIARIIENISYTYSINSDIS